MIPKIPEPPKCRLICNACGDISVTGKHTNLICRLIIWIERKFGNK